MATKMGRLELSDWVKGLLVAGLSAMAASLQQIISAGSFSEINWNVILGAGIAAGLGYIVKNFATNEKDEAFGIAATAPETPPPAKE